MQLRHLALLLAAAACTEDGPASGPGSEGAVELLAAGTGWKTLGSFTGKAVIGHVWGARRTEYDFTAQRGDLRATEAGFELLAYGVNSTQQENQNTLLKFTFDTAFRAQTAVPYLTLVDSWRPTSVHFTDERVWLWNIDVGGAASEVRHAWMTGPSVDANPLNPAQRLSLPANADGTHAMLAPDGSPWFVMASGFELYTPVSADFDGSVTSPKKTFLCSRCVDLRPGIEGAISGSDPFFIGSTLYWPAYGEQPSLLAPNRLAVFRPQAMPNTSTSVPYQYLEDPIFLDATVALNFDDYTWFRSHVSGSVAHLTWLSGSKASQLVFDPTTNTMTTRYQDVALAGVDLSKLLLHRFDEAGDLYLLFEDPPGYVVKKVTPSGVTTVASPIRFSDAKPEGAPLYSRTIEAFYMVDDQPILGLVANGYPQVEPQISLIGVE